MSKHSGRGGMGNHKHGISGHAPKSPKARMAMELHARKQEEEQKKKPKKQKMFDSVSDAFRDK